MPYVTLIGSIEERDGVKTAKMGSVRPVVAQFALEMEKKLAKNDHKTDWLKLPIKALMRKLELEFEEYKIAIEYEGPTAAKLELVDIANFCLILYDRINLAERSNEPTDSPVSA